MKHLLATTILLLFMSALFSQDTTTALDGRRLGINQNSLDSLLVSIRNKSGIPVLSVVSPQNAAIRNPSFILGATNYDRNYRPPYLAIGGNWSYTGQLDATKAKILLYGADSSSYIGMGVSGTRGFEFYRGLSYGFYFNGRLSVGNGKEANTSITDSSIMIGNSWPTSSSNSPYLFVNGAAYQGVGDASKAKLRIYGYDSSSIIGIGVSNWGAGMEYFSGLTKMHTFYGNVRSAGRFFLSDSIYFGDSKSFDAIGANYLSLGRKIIGPVVAPARIELNNSYADEPNKPLKAKLWLYGNSESSIIGFGITSTKGLEIFAGSPGVVTYHGLPKYDVNRAANFDTRTLVDKGYVDSVKNTVQLQWAGTNTQTSAISRTGSVGIGGPASTNSAEKLMVNGTIKAKRVVVTLQGWGDYVFDSTYQLRSLAKVAAFIKQYKHLPDMPAGTQLEREGGDMAALLKQQQVKIEELTLYAIEQEKKQAALQLQMEQQLKMIEALQAEITNRK